MTTYYEGHGWRVTGSLVRTPKRTFSLDRIEAVSLRRTFFLMAAVPAGGAILLVAFWWRYLFLGEIALLLGSAFCALIVSFQFGVLKVDALALKDEEGGTVFGRFGQLANVRAAIETAMHERKDSVQGADA